jgi:hypothetical protein
MSTQTKTKSIAGWILTTLLAALLLFSATMKFQAPKEMVEGFTGKMGYPESTLFPIGVTEVACLAVYLIPQTAVLGLCC